MARKLKPLDVERKIRPGKFCASWKRSGVNPCPDRTGLRGMSGYETPDHDVHRTSCGSRMPNPLSSLVIQTFEEGADDRCDLVGRFVIQR